jgi:hypothetical protein
MAEEPEQVEEQDRVAAAGRIEERRTEIAVGQQHRDRPGGTGSASSKRNAVTRIDQTKSGMRCSVIPGARMWKIVVMKLIELMIDEAPARCSEAIAMSMAALG